MLPNEKSPNSMSALQANPEGQSNDDKSPTSTEFNRKRKKVATSAVTFTETTNIEPASQSSSAYKELLSQPARSLTHRQKLQWLQARRREGLWAQCDDCQQWRYLPHVLDACELPQQWRCHMNPDKSFSSCSVPEAPLLVREEEDLIHGPYAAGSVVWARLAGWPWWPAMVDDEPDTEQFYWLDGFSDIPTYYNVSFFDDGEVTRAWIATEQLKPYAANRDMAKQLAKGKDKKYKKRLGAAITQAEDALRLPLQNRLNKYSFLARFSGAINKPRKVTKAEIKKFQDRLKRKYNVDFTDESSSDSDDSVVDEEISKRGKRNARSIRKNSSVKTPKAKKGKKKERTPVVKTNTALEVVKVPVQAHDAGVSEILLNTEPVVQTSETAAQASITEKQNVDTIDSVVPEDSYDNDTSDTYVPPKENVTETQSTTSQESETVTNCGATSVETPKSREKGSYVVARNLQDSLMDCSEFSEGDYNLEKIDKAVFKQPRNVQDSLMDCSESSEGDESLANIEKAVFKQPKNVQDSLMDCSGFSEVDENFRKIDNAVLKQPNSMTVQVGSNVTKEASMVAGSFDNDTSTTYVPDSEEVEVDASLEDTVREIRTRRESAASDDFDF